MKILIYSPKSSSRLEYIVEFIFAHFLQVDYLITNSMSVCSDCSNIVLEYNSEKELKNSYFIPCHPFIFETTISNYTFNNDRKEKDWSIFNFDNSAGFHFDIFSASFYIISRYEEYLPFQKDNFGRFSAKESILYQNNALDFPIIHHWIETLVNDIKKQFSNFEYKTPVYQFIPSVDIDIAFAYKGRNLKRQVKGILKNVLFLEFKSLFERIKCILNHQNDPYDTYSTLKSLSLKYKKKFKLFLQCGNYKNTTDKSLIFEGNFYQAKIKEWKEWAEIGMHPSVLASKEIFFLNKELMLWKNICLKKCKTSRQHYLSLSFPDTYNQLISFDIQHDYTMGYADEVGYRAGVGIPFYFFDVQKNCKTNLLIHPFQIMDGTLQQYLNLSPADGLEVFRKQLSIAKKYGVEFCILWHNQSFSDIENWKEWKDIFIQMFEEAAENEKD